MNKWQKIGLYDLTGTILCGALISPLWNFVNDLFHLPGISFFQGEAIAFLLGILSTCIAYGFRIRESGSF